MPERPTPPSSRVSVGTACLFCGLALFVLCMIEAAGGVPLAMPRSWYTSQELWWFTSIVLMIGGALLLSRTSAAAEEAWRPSRGGMRFQRVVLYTRRECELCDEARDVLERYRTWLPRIDEIDVDADPRLVEKFGSCVPVVACDGKVRFKGRVNETLLRRLIEGAPPRN